MSKVILHLSNTDIRFDSRILKELSAIEELDNIKLFAIGIEDNTDKRPAVSLNNTDILSIKSVSKKLKFIPRPFRYLFFFLEIFFMILFKGIKLKPKIIHCHDTFFLPIAMLISVVTNSKLIYDAHELESNKGGQTKILSVITFMFEKLAWNRIDLFISVAPSIINWYQNKFSEKRCLLILNSPILVKRDKEVDLNYLRQKFNVTKNKKIFIYIGEITKGRSIEIYLDIFSSENINSHIVFIGYGDLVSKVLEFQSNFSNIHYHHPVSHDKVVDIAMSADIGLCIIQSNSLSDYFCLPNKLFEYAFAKTYVLVSNFPDMKDLIKQYDLGSCTSVDKDCIKDIITELEKSTIKKNNSDLSSLSWQSQAQKLKNEYQYLINLINS
jgi:glycosyltransferase involved in cell wall biosynthesis